MVLVYSDTWWSIYALNSTFFFLSTLQLVAGQAECMVCLEKIRPTNATWHCDGECFQVFHIHCIKKWSKTARTEDQGGWRCPGKQNV